MATRAEKSKAHAELLGQLRNVVKAEFLNGDMSRVAIRKAIDDAIAAEVKKRINSHDVAQLMKKLLIEELTRIVGGDYIPKTVKEQLSKEIGKLAAVYVERSVAISTIDVKDTW